MTAIPEKPLSELSITSPFTFFKLHDGVNTPINYSAVDSGNNGLTALDLADNVSTTVDASSAAGGTVLNVTSEAGFSAGDKLIIGRGTGLEEVNEVASTAAGVLNLVNDLTYTHTDLLGSDVDNLECWSDNDGWYTTDGTNQKLYRAWESADTSNFALDNGVMLLFGQVMNNSSGTEIIMHIGTDAPAGPSIQIRTDGSGGLRLRLRDDDGVYQDSALNASGLTTGGATPVNFAVIIDNTATKQVTGYINGAGGTAYTITGSTFNPSSGGIGIGIGYNGSWAQLPWTGSARRLGCVVFDTMPANLTAIITELHKYNSMPYWLMDGI